MEKRGLNICFFVKRCESSAVVTVRKQIIIYSKRGKDKCTKTRHWFVKIAKTSLFSLPRNRSFTLQKVSRTSPRDVRLAVTQERTLKDLRGNTLQLLAQDAARKQEFLSSPPATDLFIAAIASQQ